jgi:hypothetical protein
VGSITWLQPVDVRGLALEGLVRIEQGEVAVYRDGPAPPVGQGLNTAALVALHNVHRLDKGAGQPVEDPQVGG